MIVYFFLFDEKLVCIYKKISSHNEGYDKFQEITCYKSDKRSSCWSQSMCVLFACILFSEICSYKWSTYQSQKPKRSDDYAKHWQYDNRYYKPDFAATHSSLGTSKFLCPSWWDGIFQDDKKCYNHRSNDEKYPAKWMCWSQLQQDECDIHQDQARQNGQDCSYDC